MQLNTTSAFATAFMSAVIGFGLAFYIERKLSKNMQKKSQKIFTSMAMVSFGYGLTATLNEVIGFPLQGLNVKYEKLIGYFLVSMLFLPVIFFAIAKLIGSSNKAVDGDFGVQSNPVRGPLSKYFLLFGGALSVAYMGYVALNGAAFPSSATYDFYYKVDNTNCNSPFEAKPSYSSKFLFKKETNEVFLTVDYDDNGVKKHEIHKLDNCSVLNSKNWTCGGEFIGSMLSPKYMFVDGVFAFDKGISTMHQNCDVRIEKR